MEEFVEYSRFLEFCFDRKNDILKPASHVGREHLCVFRMAMYCVKVPKIASIDYYDRNADKFSFSKWDDLLGFRDRPRGDYIRLFLRETRYHRGAPSLICYGLSTSFFRLRYLILIA
jgi:hypothetical protein